MTADEERLVGPIPLFTKSIFVFWKDKMESFLQGIGCNVWFLVIIIDTSTNESRRYNSKFMSIILSDVLYSTKSNVCQCSSTKHI